MRASCAEQCSPQTGQKHKGGPRCQTTREEDTVPIQKEQPPWSLATWAPGQTDPLFLKSSSVSKEAKNPEFCMASSNL